MASRRVKLSELTRLEVAYSQGYRCGRCDALLTAEFEVDHIASLALGGHPTAKFNLSALCPGCHAWKTAEDGVRLRAFKSGRTDAVCGGCGDTYSLYFLSNHLKCRLRKISASELPVCRTAAPAAITVCPERFQKADSLRFRPRPPSQPAPAACIAHRPYESFGGGGGPESDPPR